MSSIIQSARKSTGSSRAHAIMKGAGYKRGGGVDSDEKQDEKMVSKGVHEHEAHLHKGEAKTKLKFKSGGHVHGKHPKGRADHKSRTKININVGAGQAEKQAAAQQGLQQGIKVGAAAAAPKPPMPPMAGPPPGAGGPPPMPPRPPMAGPGMPPGGPMKKGGMVRRAAGGRMAIPHLKGGSGGGEGRIAKAADYGEGSIKLKSHLRKYPHKRGGRAG